MVWFDIFILVVVIIALGKGYYTGLVMQIAMLVGFVVSAVFAGQLASMISPTLMSTTGLASYIVKPLSYISAFVLIILAFLLFGRMMHEFLKTLKMDGLNRWAGGAFGIVKYLIIVSVVLNVIVELDQKSRLITSEVREKSYTYPYVKGIAPYFVPFLRFDFYLPTK